MTDEPQIEPEVEPEEVEPTPEPTIPLNPNDPAYWQALIDGGLLAEGLAALAGRHGEYVRWDQVDIAGTLRYLRAK